MVYSYGNISRNPIRESRPTLFVFNILEKQWSEITLSESFPEKYLGAVTWMEGTVLYLFGGQHPFTLECTNDLWSFDLERKRWSKIETKKPLPPVRHSALSWQTETAVWMLGGGYMNREGQLAYRNDLWAWDIRGKYWKEFKNDEIRDYPSPRSQSIVWHDTDQDLVYVYGGLGNIGGLNDLWVGNYESNEWKNLHEGNGGFAQPVNRFTPVEEASREQRVFNPGWRYQSASWISDKALYLYGGHRDEKGHDGYVWKYNLESNVWKPVYARNYIDIEPSTLVISQERNHLLFLGSSPSRSCPDCLLNLTELSIK